MLSPRVMCQCGKSVLRLSDEQRKAYDDHVRRLEEPASGKPSRAQEKTCLEQQEETISSIESTPSDAAHANE